MDTTQVEDFTDHHSFIGFQPSTNVLRVNPFLPTSGDDAPENIYIREAYTAYYEFVHQVFDSGRHVITVVGSSGIGTSCFYAYFFGRLRAERSDVSIVTAAFNSDRVFRACLVFRPGSLKGKRVSRVPQIPGALYLFDGAPDMTPFKLRTVCFTSPNHEWHKSIYKSRVHCRLFLPAWTLQELLTAAATLGLPLSPDRIQERFKFFGGSARYCLVSEEEEDSFIDDDIATMRELGRSITNIEHIMTCFDSKREAESLPNLVFHVAPEFRYDPPLPCSQQRLIASDEIRDILENVLMKTTGTELGQMVAKLRIARSNSILVDWLFVLHVARIFKKRVGRLDLTGISNSAERLFLYLQRGVFERLPQSDPPHVDGVFSDNESGIVYLLQVTRGKNHVVNVYGIWALLNQRQEAQSLTQNRVVLVFIVPPNGEEFGIQSFESPEFPLREATEISSIPGFGPVENSDLHSKRIHTAHDLRIQLGQDESLEKYRARLEMFELWYKSAYVSTSITTIPQFRLILPDDFDQF